MHKIYKEYKKAQFDCDVEIDQLSDIFPHVETDDEFKKDRELSANEKKYLLAIERGDIATAKNFLDEASSLEKFDKNVLDPLGRSALHIAIEYENIEMIQILLDGQVILGEALLHAINEEFVEAVEIILKYQDNHVSYSYV